MVPAEKYGFFGAVPVSCQRTKYFNFSAPPAMGSLGLLRRRTDPRAKILMPLGISYYTLMGISYVVDVYRGTANPEKNPLMLLLYLCYFPHIIEGPFDRYTRLTTQFRTPHLFDYTDMKTAESAHLGLPYHSSSRPCRADRQYLQTRIRRRQVWRRCSCTLLDLCRIFRLHGHGVRHIPDVRRGHGGELQTTVFRRFHQRFLAEVAHHPGRMAQKTTFYPVSLLRHFQKINERLRRHIASI